MTRNREIFNDLDGKDLQMHNDMGDDGKQNAIGIGKITFHRELDFPLRLKDVTFVPSLKKNLISIAVLEDRGYDVILSKGKEFQRHIATGKVK